MTKMKEWFILTGLDFVHGKRTLLEKLTCNTPIGTMTGQGAALLLCGERETVVLFYNFYKFIYTNTHTRINIFFLNELIQNIQTWSRWRQFLSFFLCDCAECGVKLLSAGELLAVMVRSAPHFPLSSAGVKQTKRGEALIQRPMAGIWLAGLLI